MNKQLPIRFLSIASVILFNLLSPVSLQAKEVDVSGEFMFGPQTSRAAACDAAAQRAIDAAIRLVNGEAVSSEEQYTCRENTGGKTDSVQCALDQSTWSQINGDVRSVKNKKETVSQISGAELCAVTLTADVFVPTARPDPSFNFSYGINQKNFKVGDHIEFNITPGTAMHIAIFSYLPYLDGDKQVTRIFPNVYDKESRNKEKFTVPTGKYPYEFLVSWYESGNKELEMQDEYFKIIATKDPVQWLEEYSIKSFKSALREIPNDRIRQAQGNYKVLKEKSHAKN